MVQPAMQRIPQPNKARNIILWTLQIVTGLAFLAAGAGKFAGGPEVVAAFDKIGLGQWFRYLTGALEAVGGLLLLIPGYAFYGAALLVMVMAGAVISHLTVLGGSPLAAVLFLVAAGAIAWFRKP